MTILSTGLATAETLLSGPLGKLVLQTVGTQVAGTLGSAVANAAGSIVAEAHAGVAASQAVLDQFEASHPRAVQAIDAVRTACTGFILVPTEAQIVAALNHMIDSMEAALVPDITPSPAQAA